MPTVKKRINVTLNKNLEKGISILAKYHQMSKAAVLAKLAEEYLEFQEDLEWAKLAEERKRTHKGRYLTHEEVWGK